MNQGTSKIPYQSPSIEIITAKNETPIMMSALELYYLKMYASDDYDNEDIDDYDLF